MGRPEGIRRQMVAQRLESYTRNPPKAKADLEEFVAATRRLASMIGSPDPEADPEGYRKAFGDVCTALEAEKRAAGSQVSKAASDFVDGMAEGPAGATPEDVAELLDLCREHKVNFKSFWLYCQAKGAGRPSPDGSPNWLTLPAAFVSRVLPQMKDVERRRAFIPWLHLHHPANA